MNGIISVNSPRIKVEVKASKRLWESVPALKQLELTALFQEGIKALLVEMHRQEAALFIDDLCDEKVPETDPEAPPLPFPTPETPTPVDGGKSGDKAGPSNAGGSKKGGSVKSKN